MKLAMTLFRYFIGLSFFFLRVVSLNKIPPPIPTVSIIILDKGKILGVKRADGLGIGLPGGVIYWNETPEAAIIRETQEETGLKIKVKRLVSVYSHLEGLIGLNSINLVYSGEVFGGKLKASYEGSPGWYKPKEFSAGGTKKIISDLSVRHVLNVRT